MGIFEIMEITDTIRQYILKKAAPMLLKEVARKTQNMKTLREDGISKILAGYITVEELNRVTTE